MTTLTDIQADVASLTQSLADANAKVDTLIARDEVLVALTNSLAAQLTSLGEAGQITPGALSDLLASIDAAKTSAAALGDKVSAEVAKVDAAITADSPAPAPVEPAPEVPAEPQAPSA